MNSVRVALVRLKAKTFQQLVRLVLLRIWPLSALGRRYYRYRYGPGRYKRINREAARLLDEQRRDEGVSQHPLVKEMWQEGIVLTHVNELLPEVSLVDLAAHADDLLALPKTQDKIANRENSDDAKWYVVRSLGPGTDIELPTWMAQIVLHPKLLGVVSEYLGFLPRLTYADVWHNFPVSDDEPGIDPEHWHRDHEDRHVFKLFLYLRDIDQGAGPHQYLRRTHPHGDLYGIFPHTPPLGTYPPDDAVEAAVPADFFKSCIGPSGSLVMVDTVGFHRGGRCREHPRTLLTATYASNLSIDPNTYRLMEPEACERLDMAGRYALRADNR